MCDGQDKPRLGSFIYQTHFSNEAFQIIVSSLMCDGQDKPRLGSFI